MNYLPSRTSKELVQHVKKYVEAEKTMLEKKIEERIRLNIDLILKSGIKSFAIFPFGEVGRYAEKCFREFGIRDISVFDNYKQGIDRFPMLKKWIEKTSKGGVCYYPY